MNSVITDMYAKKDVSSSATGALERHADIVSSSSYEVAFTIDRIGDRLSHAVVESDHHRQPISTMSDSATVCDKSAMVTTCRDSSVAADDVILLEDDGERIADFANRNSSTSVPLPVVNCAPAEKKMVTFRSWWQL